MTKTFGRRRVLDDVDLELARGSFNLLVGPNGSGKTTLLRMLATIAAPSSGKIHWSRADGTNVQDPAEFRASVGYAGHIPLVYDELTVLENVETLVGIRGHDPVRARSTAIEWLARLGLDLRRNDRAETLSRGLRQRLALAQAFSVRPTLLLLDEPGSNLDEGGLDTLLKILREQRSSSTIVVATHEPDPFRPIADRVLEVRGGKVHDWGAR